MKIISKIILFLFIFSSISFAEVINPELGEIKNTFKGTSKNTTYIIIDTPYYMPAQLKINQILFSIEKFYKKNFGLITFHYEWNDINFSSKRYKMEELDSVLNTGKISGAEYYARKNKPKLELVGIDDKNNLIEYLKYNISYFNYESQILEVYNFFKSIIEKSEQMLMEKSLADIIQMQEKYEKGEINNFAYIEYLVDKGKKAGIKVDEECPTLMNSLKLYSIQTSLDPQSLQTETEDLINNDLMGIMPMPELEKLVQLPSDKFYIEITKIIEKNKINIKTKYPNLDKYMGYNKLSTKVDSKKVNTELQMIINKLKAKSLTNNQDMADINFAKKNLELWKIYLTKSATDKQQQEWKKIEEKFFTTMIHLSETTNTYESFSKLDLFLKINEQNMEKLYTLSTTREKLLFDNYMKTAKKTKSQINVIIVDEMMALRLEQKLKAQNMSFIEVDPKCAKLDAKAYADMLSNMGK